jgi:hypothetical protein
VKERRYEASSKLRMQCVCVCKLSVQVCTSNNLQRIQLFKNKTCCGHGAIQGYRHLVTPVATVVSPRDFEQFERYCLWKKCVYDASTYNPAGPAKAWAVRYRLFPAEDWFRTHAISTLMLQCFFLLWDSFFHCFKPACCFPYLTSIVYSTSEVSCKLVSGTVLW